MAVTAFEGVDLHCEDAATLKKAGKELQLSYQLSDRPVTGPQAARLVASVMRKAEWPIDGIRLDALMGKWGPSH